ncbi:hypothetical protein [Kitasatospora sp. NPDC057015]|uniref:hypothetical protein n=1 Tax=Kitasatospora sp. NPDC057015 TaxID=3346001 RepID=UPI003632CFDE
MSSSSLPSGVPTPLSCSTALPAGPGRPVRADPGRLDVADVVVVVVVVVVSGALAAIGRPAPDALVVIAGAVAHLIMRGMPGGRPAARRKGR